MVASAGGDLADDGPGGDRLPGALGSLLFSMMVVAAIAAAGAHWSDGAPGSWYDGLAKPAWTPPGEVLGAAWTLLYALMAVAAWWVARRGLDRPIVLRAMALYIAQLVLNAGWTWVFFGLQRPGWALVEIVVLDVIVVSTVAAFWVVGSRAALLLVPYVVWLAFATTLNAAIVVTN